MNLKKIVTAGALAVGSMLYTGCSTTKDYNQLSNMPHQVSAVKLADYGSTSPKEEQDLDTLASLTNDQKEAAMSVTARILLRSEYAPKGKAFADKLALQNGEEVSVALPGANVQSYGTYNDRNTNLNSSLGQMNRAIQDYVKKNPIETIKVITYRVNDDENGLTSITSIMLNSELPGFKLEGDKKRYLRGIKEGFSGNYVLTQSEEKSSLDVNQKDRAIWLELGIDALGGIGAMPYGPAITATAGAVEKGIEEMVDKDASYSLAEGAGFLHFPDGATDEEKIQAYINHARDFTSKTATTPEATHYMTFKAGNTLNILIATQNDDKGEPVDDKGTYWSLSEDGNALLKLNRKGDTIDLIPAMVLLERTKTKHKPSPSPTSGGGLGNGGPQLPINGILGNGGPQIGN